MRITFSVMLSTVRFFIGGILTWEGSIVAIGFCFFLSQVGEGINWINCPFPGDEKVYKRGMARIKSPRMQRE